MREDVHAHVFQYTAVCIHIFVIHAAPGLNQAITIIGASVGVVTPVIVILVVITVTLIIICLLRRRRRKEIRRMHRIVLAMERLMSNDPPVDRDIPYYVGEYHH